ncbi:hypothetical protein N0V93_000321 [Gnomoniopsis smithogilvyi]|uniref:F-box domain-containing protein n=1 Tax=Gnomoniopsis smithogilvyi TaxID=1191159 RepID=A0A9W8Z3G4_9PEZI|nr:hypothetical protein N0V93_000321 [Gnomoniopsis smithogilvyi]
MNKIQEAASLTIDSLPAELLAHIFAFLAEHAPSDLRLHDQPDADMLRVADPRSHYLKTVSLVNRQWRATVLPLLFRNAVWYLDRLDLMRIEQSMSPSAVPLLTFIKDNNLMPYVKSLTLVIASAHPVGNGDIGLYRRGDGTGHYGYSPEPLSPSLHRGERDIIFNEDTNWLWKLVFDVISPLRFTIIASPRMLASLLARMLFLGDEWIFSQTHHILSLSRDTSRRTRPEETPQLIATEFSSSDTNSLSPSSSPMRRLITPRVPCTLFTLRPWTSVLLNEGSSTQVYKTYEYFHRRPPSLLGALLGAEAFPNDAALVPPTIQALSYVGIFPLADHVRLLVENLPRIERLFVQLVPRNDILKDRRQMKGLDMDDLWAERDSAYAHIISRIRSGTSQEGNWRYLHEFESGDVADEEAWEVVGQILASPEWHLVREGVFNRE